MDEPKLFQFSTHIRFRLNWLKRGRRPGCCYAVVGVQGLRRGEKCISSRVRRDDDADRDCCSRTALDMNREARPGSRMP
jgi:hypothetical protein